MRRSTPLLLGIVLVFGGVIAWGVNAHFASSLHLAFADEQTEIFQQMVARTSSALAESPPNLGVAIGCLQYTEQYYPSGTKQSSGSALDNIVERTRSLAVRQIVDMLRRATGEDLGAEPGPWIERYEVRDDDQHGVAARQVSDSNSIRVDLVN